MFEKVSAQAPAATTTTPSRPSPAAGEPLCRRGPEDSHPPIANLHLMLLITPLLNTISI